MNTIKIGDIVGRISYGKDILFTVEKILGNSVCILRGLNIRIQADSPVEDVEIIDDKIIDEHEKNLNESCERKLNKCRLAIQSDKNKGIEKELKKNINGNKEIELKRFGTIIYTGKILHLDGDKRYSEKSNLYYKKSGLHAIVKNVKEYKQPNIICNLLNKYTPDILVITGHDGMIKKRFKL